MMGKEYVLEKLQKKTYQYMATKTIYLQFGNQMVLVSIKQKKR